MTVTNFINKIIQGSDCQYRKDVYNGNDIDNKVKDHSLNEIRHTTTENFRTM